MRLHSAWRLFYNELAFLFDFVSGCISLGKWKAWGKTSIPYLEKKRVLELGHGPGHLLISLKTSGYRPVGIDLSPRMAAQARRRLRHARLDVPLVRCRAQALPFRSTSFDCVVATFPTNYIMDPDTLHEVARVTSGTGRLVIVAGAQRTGPQPNPQFTDWLSSFTGRNGNRKGSVFGQAGMSARIEHQPVGDGTVALIIAEKCKGDDTPVLTGEQDRALLASQEWRDKEERLPGRVGRRENIAVGALEESRQIG